jgi:hypothetical protein
MATDQYETVRLLIGSRPAWVADDTEARRLAAYGFYENIYWLVPNSFKVIQRGSEQNPIYVPSARTIVETMHRYLAPGLTIVPDETMGTDNDQALAKQVMDELSARERLYSRFSANKRMGIMRGDWAFYIYADPAIDAGSRISIIGIDPSKIFKITNPDNIEEVIGWHIAEPWKEIQSGREYIRRLTYMKETGKPGPSPITVSEGIFSTDRWGGPGMDPDDKPVRILRGNYTLPSPIDHLPIYHIPNFDEPGIPWGSSEIRGLERILASVNQSISDEELYLALDGLGVYCTDAGTPVDEDGNETTWNLGPGRVIEIPEAKNFNRVPGVTTTMPFLDHANYLHDRIDETMGMSAVAKGTVDVNVAESGIALQLELAPLLARAEEKEQIIRDVMSNMLFDLAKWYVAYEGTTFSSLVDTTRWIPVFGDKIPPNRKQQLDELMALAGLPSILSPQYIRARLRKLGYEDLPEDNVLDADIKATQQASIDLINARMTQDLANVNGNGGSVA